MVVETWIFLTVPFLFPHVCMCAVHVGMRFAFGKLCESVCVCVCTDRLRNLWSLSTLFLEARSFNWTQNSLVWLVQLASLLQGCSLICSPFCCCDKTLYHLPLRLQTHKCLSQWESSRCGGRNRIARTHILKLKQSKAFYSQSPMSQRA